MSKIDISKGRYWDKPWSLVDGCTPCSPGCDHCWSAAMANRFGAKSKKEGSGEVFSTSYPVHITNADGQFNGIVRTRPDRLDIPLRTRKPTVFAVWNDLFHEAVPTEFIADVVNRMFATPLHTYLILTKRPQRMYEFCDSLAEYTDKNPGMFGNREKYWPLNNVYLGLTVCNQQEADEKIPIFLQVPGKKFLSIEPMLGPIRLLYKWLSDSRPHSKTLELGSPMETLDGGIDAVILGGETGPGARPMQAEWVRSVRDQCAAAAVPFFFKSWGKWVQNPSAAGHRILNGRTHDELPWVKP